ncbi:MAG: aminotransferase class V-fold PLP-dependent enzyme [Sphingomicrobium sp.]
MSFKRLFSRAFDAAPDRLHFASHSHHLWPDASFAGQVEAWDDAARLADRKWDKAMGEVWPEAQRRVADELGTGRPDDIVFSSNTHDFLIRIASACTRAEPGRLRVLASDGEFHSARRQLERWAEDGWLRLTTVPLDRLLDSARTGDHDLILVSQVQYNSGKIFEPVEELAALARPDGPWVIIDSYHAFMAIDRPLGETAARSAFCLGGGYKYAMAGEGCAFLHAPAGFGPRPPVTGWFAEFEDLTLPAGRVGYASDARRFLGATFDPSGLYRFTAVQRMLEAEGLTTARISAHIAGLQRRLLDGLGETPLARAELINPPGDGPNARFLAFRAPDSERWGAELLAQNCITDVRADVLRIGFGLYNDPADVDRLLLLIGRLT